MPNDRTDTAAPAWDGRPQLVEAVARALCCPGGACRWGDCGASAWGCRAAVAITALCTALRTTPEWMDGEMVRGNGSTVCGRDGFLMMPGIFSRMGAPRCAKCCKTLGIIGGAGAPHNVLAGESANA